MEIHKPQYLIIKDFILKNIQENIFSVSSLVPSEHDLCKQFSVSRMTARRALDELAKEGFLIREKGVGSFVRDSIPQLSLSEIPNIKDDVLSRGRIYRCNQISKESLVPPKGVALELGILEGVSVFKSVLCHYENDIPIQLEVRYVNPKWVPDYLKQDFTNLTPHKYLMNIAPLEKAEQIVEARPCEEQVKKELNLQENEPSLIIKRKTWSKGNIISYTFLYHPAFSYKLNCIVTY